MKLKNQFSEPSKRERFFKLADNNITLDLFHAVIQLSCMCGSLIRTLRFEDEKKEMVIRFNEALEKIEEYTKASYLIRFFGAWENHHSKMAEEVEKEIEEKSGFRYAKKSLDRWAKIPKIARAIVFSDNFKSALEMRDALDDACQRHKNEIDEIVAKYQKIAKS